MDNLLTLRSNRDLWLSVIDMVRHVIGLAEAQDVETATSTEASSCVADEERTWGSVAQLQEAFDELHASLATSHVGPGPRAAVRQAYVMLCRAMLRAEKLESHRVRDVTTDTLVMLNQLHRPIYTALPKLQAFITKTREYAALLRARAAAVCSPGVSARLLLLADQVIAGSRLLLRAVRELELDQNTPPSHVKDGVDHVIGRLRWGLKEVLALMETPSAVQQEQVECGQFVKLMDDVLAMLDSSGEVSDETSAACEELLGHAMSVAHVALTNDKAAITANAHTLLERLQAARREEHDAMRALRLGSLEDALLQLERVVNSALLRLVLEVFSEAGAPLERLLAARGGHESQIADFDLHVERVMQAGMFAAACSSDACRVASVRSCLASLESLEPELVPAVLACTGSLQLANFYSAHWRNEVRRLADLLDQMVDPAAFCQVTAEELARLQDEVIDVQQEDQVEVTARAMVKHARKLLTLLRGLTTRGENLSCDAQVLDDIEFYTAELRASFRSHRGEKWHRRIKQRARLLTLHVRALAVQLQDADVSTNKQGASGEDQCKDNMQPMDEAPTDMIVEEQNGEENESMLATPSFPDSVHGLPLDIATPQGMVDLTPFIARGKRICDARSVLYRTPQRGLTFTPAPELPAAMQLFVDDEPHEISLELNISEILDGLSGLSNTLRSELTVASMPVLRSSKIGASLRLRRERVLQLQHNMSQPTACSTMASPSLGSQVVSASSREADLRFLNDKIERLKLLANPS